MDHEDMTQGTKDRAQELLRRRARHAAFVCLLGAVAVLVCGCFLTPNLPPIARILADGLEGTPPLAIQFDGTSSTDEDGIVCGFTWSFGDGGVTSAVMRPAYVYALPGEYVVTLMVTDDDGDASSTQVTVLVTTPNSPPVAVFTAVPSAVVPGEIVAFDASGSLDGDGWIAAYHWDFGDGTSAQGVVAEHQYAVAGTYAVTLTVADNGDAMGTVQSEMLVIDTNQAPQPQLVLSTTALDPGDTLVCSAAGSIDPDGEIVAYEWSFGDGAQASGATASHVYTTEGSYRVRLTAIDNQGAMQATERAITVGSPTVPTPPPTPTPT
ncbi:PKD domain-containing protein, partial [Candidatus Bipolaricaulota bacterium]|nr:PKD domain-containing protein [Candidatus Bipolaricaulota bacterium]